MAIHIARQAFHLVTTVLVLCLTLFAYERSIEPLYGSIPTAYYLAHVLYAATTIACFIPVPSLAVSQFLFGAFLCAAPTTTYWVGVLTGRQGDPKFGPLATHLVVLAPIFFVGTSMHLNSRLVPSSPPALEFGVKSQMFYYIPFLAVRMYLSHDTNFLSLPEDVLFLALGALSLITWRIINVPPKSEALQGRSKSYTRLFNVLILLAAIIVPAVRAPTLRHPLSQPYDHPTYPLRVLSSVQSITGIVVVGEALPPTGGQNITAVHSMRYLRASHSLLGGVWIGDQVTTINDAPPVNDSEGTPLGDSVYATFVLQEAARLVDSTEVGRWENALIIGLGTGISASAFFRHNISTTIVEIDPAVYAAARQYFGLPDPGSGRVFLEDARGWVMKKRAGIVASNREVNQELYDIVVHDCFSGGGLPKHIFTFEFWEDLKLVMNPEGVLAVNYAGHTNSNVSRSILHTLRKTFGHCRVFHDSLQGLTEEQYQTEFINMVFFCGVSSKPLSFRPATESDYLSSYLRQSVLSSLPEREVDLVRITGDLSPVAEGEDDRWLLTDLRNPLDTWQQDEGLRHWKVMREVLPDVFWETY